jgi:diguanylate cyclase (GGDEF)-like protein
MQVFSCATARVVMRIVPFDEGMSLIKRIIEIIQRWRYLGYDRDTVQRYRAETDRANLRTLRYMCLLVFVLAILLFLAYDAIVLNTTRIAIMGCIVVILATLFFYINGLLKDGSTGPIRGIKSLVYLVSVIMYLCGILSGTLLSDGDLGVMGVWVFLLVQISFYISPVQNALTVIPFAALFLIVGKQFKSLERWQLDLIYTNVSVLVGLFISHHQAKLELDNLIAQSNLQKANFALYHTATTDDLTGLMNRRMLFDRYDEILKDCVMMHSSMACVVLDIDDYKQFNDNYGHPEGDALLRRIGSVLRTYCEEQNIVIGRIGGEEFLAVWAEEDVSSCKRVAEELRCAVEHMAIPHSGAQEHKRVTMSVGVCLLPSTQASAAYYYADKALYRAKEAGKNCSCRYDARSGSYRRFRFGEFAVAPLKEQSTSQKG